MQKNQRTFFIVMGIFQILIVTIMAGWMVLDAAKAIASIPRQPLLHTGTATCGAKTGEILPVFATDGFAPCRFLYFLETRLCRFCGSLRVTTPLMMMGGVLQPGCSLGVLSKKPRTEFTRSCSTLPAVVPGRFRGCLYYWDGFTAKSCSGKIRRLPNLTG